MESRNGIVAQTDEERKAILLAEVVRTRGLQTALFDLDDTLIITGKLFERYIADFTQPLALKSGKDPNTVYDFFIDSIRGLRTVFSVHPTLLAESARLTTLYCGCDFYSPDIQAATSIMMEELYGGHNAKALDGSKQTLAILHQAGVDTVLVTHAGEMHTWNKLKAAGLNGRFAHICCVDDCGHKNTDAWQWAFDQAHTKPENGVVVGDNWQTDILPALELGVPSEQVVRIRRQDDHLKANPFVDHIDLNEIAQLDHVGELVDHMITHL